ncbi:hypothetical protein [Dactylosporangium salmoneum]|uniref:Uncharacterized protein n=1 Tax=Dactylosporangium salmoneum TaxID=53361 RepID=A0ABN3FTS6_9ACTN
MSTLEERLREEMARSVAAVRPAPDPYGRLLRRRRRRGWRWGGLGLGAALVAAILGAQGLVAPGGPRPAPERTGSTQQQFDEPLNEWTRSLLTAPTRGDMVAAEAIREALDKDRTRRNVKPELDQIKVLYVVEAGGDEVFEAAYYGGGRGQFVSASAPKGTSVADLVNPSASLNGTTGSGAPRAFSISGRMDRYTVALAPPGCLAQGSVASKVGPDSALQITWGAAAEFIVDPAPAWARWWRVTCDGRVRQLGYEGTLDGPRQETSGPPPAERGTADPDIVKELLWSWPTIGGLDVVRKRVLWGGTPPGETRPTVVGLGELADGSVYVCEVTGKGDAQFVNSLPPPQATTLPKDFPPARMTVAVAPSAGLVAVRLPDETRVGFSDRLLVIGPPEAVQLRVSGKETETVALTGGVGVIVAPVPARVALSAVDGLGRDLARLTVVEPGASSSFLLGLGWLYDWS